MLMYSSLNIIRESACVVIRALDSEQGRRGSHVAFVTDLHDEEVSLRRLDPGEEADDVGVLQLCAKTDKSSTAKQK